MVIMSEELKQQLRALSEYIAADCEGFSAIEIAEICMDANRLTTAGYPELDEELSSLVKQHGYAAVLEEGAEHVSVW